jgi:glucosamine--fructose-6-phosphate aminotransferase (isomerizing)
MCGIFGIITENEQVLGPKLIDAGHRLSYRGYDSVGCATIDHQGQIDLRKDAGKVDQVSEKLNFKEMVGMRGILQLRWATFGVPSQVNSQPHIDSDGDLVGAHNGNVVNNAELREQFMAEGMTVRSMNDGESCVHAVERYVDRGYPMLDAIRMAYNDLEGDYSFVIGKVDEDCLYAFKKGSGLVAGITADTAVVSSDLPSLLPITRDVLHLNDGEIVVLRPGKLELYRVADGEKIEREIETITETMEAAQKGGYDHFMLKEIHEQPTVAKELLHLLDNSGDVDAIVERMKKARNLYFIACGTSYHACMLGAVYFSQIAGRPVIPVLAPQFKPQYGATLSKEDVGFFVSQSGETKDVLNAIEAAQERGMGVFGLVNVVGSTMTKICERCLPLGCGYEISVPATKTFTNQVLAFLYLAMRMGGEDTNQLAELPQWMEETIKVTDAPSKAIVSDLAKWQDLYCLGYGTTYAIALEGALKLKEVTYVHCEGMLSTEFKHGPLSAVSQDYPVLFVADPKNIPLIVSGINEVTCRGARAIVIGEADERLSINASNLILLPKAPYFINALLSVIPLQLISYYFSLELGFDPDFPRNLSKTLTVD